MSLTILIILLVAAFLLAIAGWFMVLLAAFRESFLWGICSLFFLPANIVFCLLHWDEAKKGVATQLAGLALLGVAYLGVGREEGIVNLIEKTCSADGSKPTSYSASSVHTEIGSQIATTTAATTTAQVSSAALNSQEPNRGSVGQPQGTQDSVRGLQSEIATLEAKLTEDYTRLANTRKDLKTSDQVAVRAFNVEAAAYAKANQDLAERRAKLAKLLQQRGNTSSAPLPN